MRYTIVKEYTLFQFSIAFIVTQACVMDTVWICYIPLKRKWYTDLSEVNKPGLSSPPTHEGRQEIPSQTRLGNEGIWGGRVWKGPYTNNIGGGASAFHFYRLRVPCPSHVIFKRPAPPPSIASMPSVHFLTPGALARAPVAVAFSPSAPSHASALPSLEHGIRGI